MLLDKNIKSYFGLLNKWKKDKKSLSGCPKFPAYKHKTKGRNIIIFTENQARINNGVISFPKKSGLENITTKISGTIKQVRIIPQSGCYVIEVVYEKEQKVSNKNDNFLSIDLGVNNLATCITNVNNDSFIINGRELKSINQYYNKKKANIQSQLEKNHNRKWSNRLTRLNNKHNNKINDYLHKCSRIVVDYCVKNDISNVIVGKNVGWKQNINIGKKNNQNFVQIPHAKLIYMIRYKLEDYGILLKENEESYTSKCSALDLEDLKKQDSYLGRRVKRGLFISSEGVKINADVNGAINILRKVSPNKGQEIVQTLRCRGQVVWPAKINIC